MNRLFPILLFPLLLLFACEPSTEKKTVARGSADNNANEKVFVKLGGEEQYVEIMSTSAANPVMLFVHGGPAWPQTPQMRYYNSEIADKYTLVLWEQRGAGQSYLKNPKPENLSLEQIIQDGLELTKWLKEKYGQEKIYLAGYSWGSIIGVRMAQQAPNDFHAYLGIAQFINKDMGMEISQRWLLEKATAAGNKKDLAALDSLKDLKNYPDRTSQFFRQWQLLNKYRGAVYNAEADKETEKAMAMYEDYKDYDWYKAWRESSEVLSDALYETNLLDVVDFEIPIYLFLGRHDWNVPAVLAYEWLETMDAPQKEAVWFEESGHGPLEEEPEKFNEAILSVVQ